MKCHSCGAKNPASSKFCKECGEKLNTEISCPQCGSPNKPNSKFCMECGQPLQEKATKAGKAATRKPSKKLAAEPASQPTTQTIIIRERERRGLPGVVWAILGVLLSVMLCVLLLWFDVVDVPAGLTERLPEPLAQVVEAIEDHNLGGPTAGLAEGQEAAADQEDGGAQAADGCELINAGEVTDDFSLPSTSHSGYMHITFPADTMIELIGEVGKKQLIFQDAGGIRFQTTVNRSGAISADNSISHQLQGSCRHVEGTTIFCFLTTWKGGWPVENWFAEIGSGKCTSRYILPGPCAEGGYGPDFTVTTWDAGNGALGVTFEKATPFEELPDFYEEGAIYSAQVIICPEDNGDTCWADTGQSCKAEGKYKYICTLPDFNDPDGNGKLSDVWLTAGDDCWWGFEDIAYPAPAPFFLAPSSPCKAGETYHPEWKYNNGCCTDGCWCKQSGKWGCWTTCAPKCSR